MDRTYQLKSSANKGKLKAIALTIKTYRITAGIIGSEQWKCFFEHGFFDKNLDIKHLPSALSARYKQTCQYQVVGILNSFVPNRQNEFVDIVRGSSLGEKRKHKLFIVNSMGLWQSIIPFSYLKDKVTIGKDDLTLARKIFSHVLSKHRKPSFRHINMALDSKVALLSEKKKNKAKTFDYWIRLSTLEKGNPVYVPITTNGYFEGILGERRNFCQINLTEDNQVSVCFIKNVPKKDNYLPLTNKVALDLGLSTLLASDRGDLFGRDFFAMLKKHDPLITELAANRQRQGLRVRSRKYDNLIGNLREYLKNEINRVINRIVKIYSPAEIVVERLNFQHPNLSRRMNRLLSRFGKGLLRKKLYSLSETHRIKITETNPAYSSQECCVCGYVDKDNRKSQSVFKCKCCDETIHADVNAARNHAARSSGEGINIYLTKQFALGIVVQRFLRKLALLSKHADSGSERLPKRYDSLANGLLPDNPYFRGYPAQLKGFS